MFSDCTIGKKRFIQIKEKSKRKSKIDKRTFTRNEKTKELKKKHRQHRPILLRTFYI